MKILTLGTFDLFHEGHKNLIDKLSNEYGQENIVLALSSDENSLFKHKTPFQTYDQRKLKINELYPAIKVAKEISNGHFSDLSRLCRTYDINVVVLGEDHVQYICEIQKQLKDFNSIELKFEKRFKEYSSTSKRNEIFREMGFESKHFSNISLIKKYEASSYLNFSSFINDINESHDVAKLNPWNVWKNVWKLDNLIYREYIFDKNIFGKEHNINNLLKRPSILTKKGMIETYIDGKTVKSSKWDIERITNVLSNIKKFKKRMLTFDTKSIEKTNDLSSAESIFNMCEKLSINNHYELIKSRIENLPNDRKYICHGDLNLGNIVFDHDNVFFIDFEYTRIDYRFYDEIEFLSMLGNDWDEIFNILNSINIGTSYSINLFVFILLKNAFNNIKKGERDQIQDLTKLGVQYKDRLLSLIEYIIYENIWEN